MAAYISQYPGSEETIVGAMHRSLLDDEYLKWITKDDRQHKWLTQQLLAQPSMGYVKPPIHLLGRDLVVAIIDNANIDRALKSQHLNDLEFRWNQHKEGDHIFKWFKGENESQRCSLIWEWLSKNKTFFTSGKDPVDNHEKLLSFFDAIQFSEAEKTVLIATVKKRWTQLQYREKMTGKKQYNFVLSDKAIKDLDKLAKTYDLKRTQILEVLIKMEAEKGAYIPERLKIIQNL